MRTPKIRYYLENQKKLNVEKRLDKEPIMAEISYGYIGFDKNGRKRAIPFRVSLKKSIEPYKFGLANKNFKFDKDIFYKATKNNATIRTIMNQLQKAVDFLESKYELDSIIPKPEKFKDDLLLELGRKEKYIKSENKIIDFLLLKIDKSEDEIGGGKRNSIVKNTIKTYSTIARMIENYQLATNQILTFENFNKTKYWEFWDVLDKILKDEIKVDNPNQMKKQRKQSHGYLINTLRKYQGALIRTLKDADEDDEFDVNITLNIYDKNLILEKQEAAKDIYVTEKELQKIIDFNLDDDEELQMAKDYIIIGSLTGMRFESMEDTSEAIVEVYKDNKFNFKYIHSKQNKTSTEIYIPLLAPVIDVLNKYNNQFPSYKHNATINRLIKKLFKDVGLNRLETEIFRTYRSGEIQSKTPLYKLISTHDCRKTFYTNLYNKQVNPTAIDNMTHPDATQKNRMAKVYNKSNMLDKAKMFVDEINKIESKIYKF